MKIGYARTSTVDQEAGFAAQIRDLEQVGCDKIFREQVSAVGKRPELAAALDFAREGDSLVVIKLDRLARSMRHLGEIVATLKAKKAGLLVLNLGIDTNTPTGALVLNLLGSVAEFERDMMLERQREGIAKAKAEGKYRGRKPTAKAKAAAVRALKAEGKGGTEIAQLVGIGRASVYRILSEAP